MPHRSPQPTSGASTGRAETGAVRVLVLTDPDPAGSQLLLQRTDSSGIPVGPAIPAGRLTGTLDADTALEALGWIRIGPWYLDTTGAHAHARPRTPRD